MQADADTDNNNGKKNYNPISDEAKQAILEFFRDCAGVSNYKDFPKLFDQDEALFGEPSSTLRTKSQQFAYDVKRNFLKKGASSLKFQELLQRHGIPLRPTPMDDGSTENSFLPGEEAFLDTFISPSAKTPPRKSPLRKPTPASNSRATSTSSTTFSTSSPSTTPRPSAAKAPNSCLSPNMSGLVKGQDYVEEYHFEPSKPEQHGPVFAHEFRDEKTADGGVHDGVEFLVTVDPRDAILVTASVVSERLGTVLFKVPSVPCIIRDNIDEIKAKQKALGVYSAVAGQALNVHLNAIDDDEDRETKGILIHCKSALQNSVFSPDSEDGTISMLPVPLSGIEVEVFTKTKQFNPDVLFFRVAFQDPKKRRADKKQKKKKMTNLEKSYLGQSLK